MKLTRIFGILLIILIGVILNWNCRDSSVTDKTTPGIINPVTADDPNEQLSLWVHEYCHITPVSGSPYDAYLQIKLISHAINPIGYTNDGFTTPDSIRTDREGNQYQTINYRVTKIVNWKCRTNNCAGRFYISGVLSFDQFYNSGNCTTCSTPPYYCNTYFDQYSTSAIRPATSYTMYVGSDCIVDDKWEAE
ncbi:MAG: hypothetical protein IT280_10915 [Ignavibacteria bacterium]|nr:hypothetical protein [Ignavibacteria bacterium]